MHPGTFHIPGDKALVNQLNKKYADRVIPDVGLGVSVFDLIEASEGKVRYGDGCYWHKGGWLALCSQAFALLIIMYPPKSHSVWSYSGHLFPKLLWLLSKNAPKNTSEVSAALFDF